jgi:hypothetical protein
VGLAKAKADHEEGLEERRQLHELTAEEKQQLLKLAPVREAYEEGGLVVLVGKDIKPSVGMRVRMREGLISHGVGTVTAVLGIDCTEEEGCCEVVWDSDQHHTRSLHVKLGNKHVCRTGKEGHFDLVLAEETMCSDLNITTHTVHIHGYSSKQVQVQATCKHRSRVPGLDDAAGVSRDTERDSDVSVAKIDNEQREIP